MQKPEAERAQKNVKGPNGGLDEVKLQSHLLGLEIKDQLNLLREDKRIIKRNLRLASPTILSAAKHIKESMTAVGRSLTESYMRIKSEIADLYSRKM